MSFKKNDIVTFDNNDKVLVLQVVKHNGVEYLYCTELTADETSTTDKYEILEANYSDGTLDRVTDMEKLKELVPIFERLMQEELKNAE